MVDILYFFLIVIVSVAKSFSFLSFLIMSLTL